MEWDGREKQEDQAQVAVIPGGEGLETVPRHAEGFGECGEKVSKDTSFGV